MTKNELAGKVAESAGIGVGQAKGAVDAVFDAIAAELASGGEVSVAGFGKFGVSHRAARSGRNIIYIPIGQLSPVSVKKIRVVHVLDGYDKREIAKDYLW